jgi:conjugal transfer protein traD
MARQSSDFLSKSTSIGIITTPFKWICIILLIVIILFISSISIQSYFGQEHLLEAELLKTQQVFSSIENDDVPFHIKITRFAYETLYLAIFNVTGIESLLSEAQSDAINFGLAGMLDSFKPELAILNDTLKIISIRIGNISAFFPLLFISISSAFFDGLMKRKVRQQNAGRESAAIYHRAKFWRTGILWTTIFIYLSMPFSIDPIILLIPITLLSIAIFLQAKYLKKYL